MIYTRNYGRNGTRYELPPGYDGNAFSQNVKLHEAEDDVTNLRRPPEPVVQHRDDTSVEDIPKTDGDMGGGKAEETSAGAPVENDAEFERGIRAFESLFRHLRGKFGREELIIVLVMLLISSEGASAELMLLALVLVAG